MGGLFGGGSSQTITTSSPIISGFRVQSSAYAGAIARIFGKTRVAANLMWYGDFTAVPHTTRTSSGGGGGKGGGGGGKVTQVQTTYTYTAAALLLLGRGTINAVPRVWRDKEQTTLAALGLSLYSGNTSQTPFPHLTTNHPGEALAYRGLAYVASAALDLGENANLGNHSFEVEGELPYSGSIKDANPRDVVTALLLEAGLALEFIGNLDAFSNYCVANGIFIAPAYAQQQSAAEAIGNLARIGNAEVICSEERVKLVPYSDQYVYGNGVTYMPNVWPLFEFTDDDFLADSGDSPVQFEDNDTSDAFNIVTIQYYNRAKDYAEDVVQARDDDHIALYGERPMDPITLHEIVDTAVARLVAQVELQRQLYYRMRYRFNLGPGKADLLEPMDVVAITDAQLGLDALPVRILEIEEIDDEGRDGFRFYVREFPAGAGSAVIYSSESGVGYSVNFNAAPGSVNTPVIFDAPGALSVAGYEMWLAVSGGPLWGGCQVWVATDPAGPYKQVGSVYGNARHGVMAGTLAVGGDPDTTNTAPVDLTVSRGELTGGTVADADDLLTLCWIDGELVAYQDATLTAQYKYTLGTYLRRGVYGTPIDAHIAGERVVRIDQALFRYVYGIDLIGSTIYIKLPSFNIWGGGVENIDSLSAYSATINGPAGKPLAVTGLGVDAEGLYWTAAGDVAVSGYEIRLGGSDWDSAAFVARVDSTRHALLPQTAGTHTWRLKAHYANGNASAAAASVVQTVTAPAAPSLSGAFVGPNLLLTWTAPAAQQAILEYELRRGTTWAGGSLVGRIKGTTRDVAADFVGAVTFWVAAIDAGGNVGAVDSVEVNVTAPLPPVVQAQVIDNNVLLYWTDSTQTLPIVGYEIRRGATWAGATVIGTKQGLFTTVFETTAGVFTYWVAGIDSAGNTGTPSPVAATVSQPPDYVLFVDQDSTFSGTFNNAALVAGAVVLPIDATETWAAHFTTRGWASPQAQIDAGYPLYIEPGLASGYYEEQIDYGTLLAGSKIIVTATGSAVAGSPVVVTTISVKAALGDVWTDYVGVTEIYVSNFRYVKWKIAVTGSGGDDFYQLTALNLRIDAKLLNDAGSVAAVAGDAGGTTVNFNLAFIDVAALTVNAQSIGAGIPLACIYDFTDAPNPTSFKVLVFRTDTGARVSTTVSWTAKGY